MPKGTDIVWTCPVYAEPQHYYAKPDVNFFGALKNKKQPIAFYDSVCGIPLFHIPKHRTLKDFEAETTEHGWPSYRPDEAVKGNIVIRGMEVLSACGTHLGSNLPDAKGDRYCLDLSCVSGNPIKV